MAKLKTNMLMEVFIDSDLQREKNRQNLPNNIII